ncbi:TetR/AcrR family transcriptional regulator [Paenibacillus cymbidii]|uniref:TetR/AcrR family transcriptional regulator n=1 Tax=Paenibacillus cymbidii TaxID=1639034 RepID=UPI00108110AD|nr:TetR/AcrR family transcriptional regulator [Paenibacillus cymbidii]
MAERKERRDAAEHRRIILQKAKSLFAEHGVEGVSMYQIARSAGVGQGTLYRRYAGKSDLCLDIIQESFRVLCDELTRYLDRHRDTPVRERLDMAIGKWLAFIEDKTPWIGELRPRECESELFFASSLYVTVHGLFRSLLEEAGRLPGAAAIDAVLAADGIIASASPFLYSHQRQGRGYSMEAIKRHLLALYVDPLCGRRLPGETTQTDGNSSLQPFM